MHTKSVTQVRVGMCVTSFGWSQPDGGTQYTGIGRFGRVHWLLLAALVAAVMVVLGLTAARAGGGTNGHVVAGGLAGGRVADARTRRSHVGPQPGPQPGPQLGPQPGRTPATSIQQLENRAQQVTLTGRFMALYRLTLPAVRGHETRGEVLVEQESRDGAVYRAMYRNIGLGGAKGPAEFEVFQLPKGYFSCSKSDVGSPWRCVGPYKGMGMSDTFGMWDAPYLPLGLTESLSNAVSNDGGYQPPRFSYSEGDQPRSSYLESASVDGLRAQCVSFGTRRGRAGKVCTLRNGLIAYYRMPGHWPFLAHETAVMLSYSPRVSPQLLMLPARPERAPGP